MRDAAARIYRCLPSYGAVVVATSTSLWAAAVGAGASILVRYATTPGPIGEVAQRWPRDASFQPHGSLPVLIMFLHPHCPCSRASVEELNRLLVRQQQSGLEVFVVFVRPDGVGPGWEITGLWSATAALPGIKRICDAGGHDQRRFGAAISGETLLYDASGRLVFRGGITPARGHSGDNPGQEAISALIKDPRGPVRTAPVFGCPFTGQD